MRYYISDLHFFHARLNVHMDKRGFPDVNAMNEYMIDQWNSRVRKKDEIVILGDLSFGTVEETNELLRRLKGKKYLVLGNHDRYVDKKNFNSSLLEWYGPYREMSDEGRNVILCHYPIICYNKQFRRDGNGNVKTYMLYGHVHDTEDERLIESYIDIADGRPRPSFYGNKTETTPVRMINCFCMFSDYVPLTLDEWIENTKQRRAKAI